MLDSRSFICYRNLCISEVIGSGRFVYEYLIETFQGVVAKVMINANNIQECESYFKRRFTLKAVSYSVQSSKYVGNFYNYNSVLLADSRPAFRSVICRRVY